MAHCKHFLKSLTSTLDACTGGFVDQVKQHAALGSIFGLNVSHQVDKAPQQGSMWKKSVVEKGHGGSFPFYHLKMRNECEYYTYLEILPLSPPVWISWSSKVE